MSDEILTFGEEDRNYDTHRAKCAECGAEWTYETLTDGLCVACIERRERVAARDLANYGLPSAYTDKGQYREKTVAAKALSFVSSDCGMFLYGAPGVGKTHLSVLAYKQILNTSKCFMSAPELFLEIRETFDKGAKQTEREVLDKYCGYEYLFLDDFAAEKISEFTRETIYLLLDRRIREGKLKVFITSNLSPTQIGEQLSDRVSSRIMEICGTKNIVKISGDDWRVKQKNVVSAAEMSDPEK